MAKEMADMFQIVLVAVCLVTTNALQELLQNPDFESSSYSGNWVCNGGCHLATSNDAVSGSSSVEVTNRHHNWEGLSQTITGMEGHRYFFNGKVKLLNLAAGHMYHSVELMSKFTSQGSQNYNQITVLPMVKPSDGWLDVKADFMYPHSDNGKLDIYIQVGEAGVNYRFDGASVQEIPDQNDWKSKANARIQNIRKAPIHITVQNDAGRSTAGLSVEIKQTKSDFAFGAAIDAGLFNDPGHKSYQDFVYDFEWVVIENAFKWRLMEWTKGNANFARPMQALNSLLARGVRVRGHNMFWGVPFYFPKWIQNMDSTHMLHEMHTHVNDMMAHTKGKLEHWDVNNENLHGDYFEQHTHNPNITMDMFNWIHQLDSEVKLFLNDYAVVSSSQYTVALKNQAEQFRKAGTHIYGVGVQSYFRSFPLDMTAIEYRLDLLAEAGLPLVITELSVETDDVNTRAAVLDDVLTLYYSHPSVEGIFYWGIWDGHSGNDVSCLVQSDNFTPNAAGQKWNQLIKQKWRTDQTLPLSNTSIRGYKGEYTISIKKNGQTLETHQFTLKTQKNVTVHLSGSGSNVSTNTEIH